MLCARLVDRFVHRSHRSIAVVEDCSAVIAVTVDLPIRCSSGSSIAFNVFGVSSWFFLCLLFHHFQFCFAGVAPPSRCVRHGRCRAHFVLQSLQLRALVDVHSRGEHVGAVAFAVGLTDGKESLVSARVAGVKARG